MSAELGDGGEDTAHVTGELVHTVEQDTAEGCDDGGGVGGRELRA
jgi:hypothetical protein